MSHDEEALGKAYDSQLMRRLLAYLRPYRGKVVLAILVTIFLSVLGPLRPFLVMMAIDKLIANDMSGFYPTVALIVGSIVVQAIVQYGQTVITQWIGQKTIFNIRTEIFAKLGRL